MSHKKGPSFSLLQNKEFSGLVNVSKEFKAHFTKKRVKRRKIILRPENDSLQDMVKEQGSGLEAGKRREGMGKRGPHFFENMNI